MANSLTDKDRNILAAAWHCFDAQPKVDYQALSERLGYKTAASAKTAFCTTRKKLLAGAEDKDKEKDADADADAGDKKEATPKKRGKAADAKEEENEGEDEGGSPKKKAKSAVAKKEESASPKKRGRKSKAQKEAEAAEAEENGDDAVKGEDEEEA